MSKNESFNNSLNGIVVNLANLSNLSKLSESFIADRVVLSNAVIISDLNIDISRDQAEKTAATMENISEKQSTDKHPVKNSEKTQQANIFDEKNSEKTQQRNKSIEKQSVKSVNKTSKKSLLGELHNNQQKLSDNPGKTVDLNKSITKAPEVSL